MKYTNENGRSMVEMLGVLAIIGVLSVGGIAGYSKAMNKFKISKTTDQISMLVANIRTMFSAQGDYVGLSNEAAVNFGVVPEEMGTSATLTNPFKGSVIISESDYKGTGDSFVVVYNGLAKDACVSVATGDWGASQSSGLIAVGAFGSEQDEDSLTGDPDAGNTAGGAIAKPGEATHKVPMPVQDAVAGCNAAGSANAVVWKYY